MYLTKTHYMSALQCQKRLWLDRHHPELARAPEPYHRFNRKQGERVGAAARARFSDGVLISTHGQTAIGETWFAINRGVTILFEAAFCHEGMMVRADILRRIDEESWEIIEVKATTAIKTQHLDDLAIQHYVVERSGLKVRSAGLMILNRDCRYPDLDELFIMTDVTADVSRRMADIPSGLAAIRALLCRPEPPRMAIGSHCERPVLCPFKEHCWADVPECSIFSIPRLNRALGDELAARGQLNLADLPGTVHLSLVQRAHVSRMLSGETEIDYAGIRERMASLVFPIHFFDLETVAEAIPRHAGTHPYQQIPFQYSCHIMHADGLLDHREYLHMDVADPREALADALLADIGPVGSVVVYNASFEGRILKALARAFPSRAAGLEQIVGRLWDQLDIFRYYYRSAAFGGSNSIKRVLPALAPGLSYSDLSIRDGAAAQAQWAEMIACREAETRAGMASDLLAYCARDTEAMVAIQRALASLLELEAVRANGSAQPVAR